MHDHPDSDTGTEGERSGDSGAFESVLIRNEFSVVRLTVLRHGQGTRLEIKSTLFGTVAYLDATVLEGLSRLDPATLAGLVSLGMTRWDETHP